jgi:CelD/BcsL family acetyltransferase involved in cellulose biosynthesis
LSHAAQLTIRSVAADRVTDRDVSAWVALEARALEPNAYLSPHFVRAAARHLTPARPPLVFFVERRAAGDTELMGVAVMVAAGPSCSFPARRLVGYRTPYSPVGGMLLDREHPAEVLEALLAHVRRSLSRCSAIELPLVWTDGPLIALGRATARGFGFEPGIAESAPRAVLVPATAQAQLESKALAHRLRDIARRSRRLRERGAVGWRWHREEGVPGEVVDSFLALEHMGWKGNGGSSLRSSPGREAFFREMVAGFAAERRVMFTELTLDGVPIAATCNFLSGRRGFAFKIGWNPELRAYSPGWLNEIEFMRNAAALLGDIEFIDSGATADSYINELWLERRELTTLAIPLRFSGRLAMSGISSVRLLKRGLARCAARMSFSPARRGPVLASAR